MDRVRGWKEQQKEGKGGRKVWESTKRREDDG